MGVVLTERCEYGGGPQHIPGDGGEVEQRHHDAVVASLERVEHRQVLRAPHRACEDQASCKRELCVCVRCAYNVGSLACGFVTRDYLTENTRGSQQETFACVFLFLWVSDIGLHCPLEDAFTRLLTCEGPILRVFVSDIIE